MAIYSPREKTSPFGEIHAARIGCKIGDADPPVELDRHTNRHARILAGMAASTQDWTGLNCSRNQFGRRHNRSLYSHSTYTK
jgi:hypothetical protein